MRGKPEKPEVFSVQACNMETPLKGGELSLINLINLVNWW